jgi:GNAT superfamily N-acetyltransferase
MAFFDPPALINADHIIQNFNSGEPLLDEWLKRRALNNLESRASRTYVICQKDNPDVVGFYSLNMGQILANETAGSMRRNMPTHIPAVVLGRLAIHQTWQGKGLGRALIFDAMRRSLLASQEIAARLVIVHAISPAAEKFYLHHGFMRLPCQAPILAIDLLKYKALTKPE